MTELDPKDLLIEIFTRCMDGAELKGVRVTHKPTGCVAEQYGADVNKEVCLERLTKIVREQLVRKEPNETKNQKD